MKQAEVTAIIVTYNRKELLGECLSAVFMQSYPVIQVILIDNASTDGTYEYIKEKGFLNEKLDYQRQEKNTGGAGGFHEGMRLARDRDTDWIWIMDDDTIPEPDALENLVKASQSINEKVSFLASCVFGPNGEYMNVPNISESKGDNGYKDWYRHLDQAAVKLKDATFVSLLINIEAVRTCGLPCKDYFIWGDDTEYTMRIIKNYGPAYLIGTSRVIHKRFNARLISIKEEDAPGRIDMYRYFFRNTLINKKLYGSTFEFCKFFAGAFRTAWFSLPTPYGTKKFVTVHKGIGAYFREKGKFKEYIRSQTEN